MANLLGEVDNNASVGKTATMKTFKSEARRKIRVLSPPVEENRARQDRPAKRDDGDMLETPPAEVVLDDDDAFIPNMDDDDVPLPT